MSPIGMHALLEQAMRRVRRDATLAIIAAVATVVPVLLVLAWLLGGDGWAQPSTGPLVLETLAVIAAVTVGWLAYRRWLAGVQEPAIARNAEQGLSLPEGSVRGLLELRRLVPSGTSPALFQQAENELAGRFTGHTAADLAGPLGTVTRRRRGRLLLGLGVAVSVVALLGFASPERSRASWQPLLSPVERMSPPPLPALLVEPGDAAVARGGTLGVRVRAGDRALVTLHWRAQGDVPRSLDLGVRADTASGAIQPVDAALVYWVTAPDGATSDTFRVEPLDPLLISELVVRVDYPAYLGRAAERYETDVPPLELPEGARLTIRGRGTRPLGTAALSGNESEIALDVESDRFAGAWTPSASGTYAWRLTGRDGASVGSPPLPLEITIVPDRAPVVELAFPAADTILPPELVQAVVAEATDDYGLAGAWLVSWRVSSAGRSDPVLELPVPLTGDPDRAALRALLDARERGLVPGDTLKLFVRVRDGSPRGQEGVSRTIALRLPGRPEMRERADALAEDAAERAEELASAAAELEQATRNLERRTASSNARRSSGSGGGRPGESSMGFDEAEASRRVLQQQEQLMAQAEELRDRLASLEKSLEMAGLRDAEMQERMRELQELYDRMLTPELRESLEKLREALAQRDPEEVRRALEELTANQEEFREQLERSTELMRRAAAEQEMSALAQEARELSTQQEALAEQTRQEPPTEKTREEQEELRERTNALAEALEKLAEQLKSQGEQESGERTEEAGKTGREAEQAMEDAERSASQGRRQEAAQSGEQAAERLEQVASGLDQARSDMTEQWKREVQESLERATADALELAERQEALKERMEQAQRDGMQGQPQAGQQGAQQQSGQQQGGQQQQQQQGGQQQGGQQQQQGGQREGQQQGQGEGSQQQQQGGGQQGGGQGAGDLQSMRAEQQALQQGLQQLGRNLAEAGERTAHMNRDVGNALGRANLNMQETLDGLEQAGETGRMPTDEAGRSVDALNRLALSLLENSQQMQQSQAGAGTQQALQDLANLAQQQGALNGQTSALMPMNLGQQAMSRQLQQLAQSQRGIAEKLGGVNRAVGGRDDILGDLDAMAKEAEQLARDLQGGRLPPEVLERQERLFHRLLDAGRSLEKDETSEERVAERPGAVTPAEIDRLDPALLDAATRFRTPTPEELRGLPTAYRRLILEYFQRLNRAGGGGS